MEESERATNRRTFRWSREAREVVRACLSEAQRPGQGARPDLKSLITRLVHLSGNPRDACRRFARQAGFGEKQAYQIWTRGEQQKLFDLIAIHPVHEGALHVRAEDVQKWIDRGWLKCRTVQTGRLKRDVIDADQFCEFCKEHRSEIVGRRLNSDRLNFVQTFVFPPSHMELLPVRESKKERAAYQTQMKREAESMTADDGADDDLDMTA